MESLPSSEWELVATVGVGLGRTRGINGKFLLSSSCYPLDVLVPFEGRAYM